MLELDSPYQDPNYDAWQTQVTILPRSKVGVREADATEQDGKWLRWTQAACEALYIHSVEDNRQKIENQIVLLAEVAMVPIGYCLELNGRTHLDPLFIQLVAVVPSARRRGAGLSLLTAAAELEPRRDIALATLEENVAARALNDRFAAAIGATVRRVPLRRFRRSDLGFAQFERHKPWLIERG